MKLFSLISLYFVLTVSAFSQEIQAELNLISPPAILKEGDIVEGILKVWPLENADLNEFKKLENMSLANALYITEIENVEVSANNADVVEAKILFIVKRAAGNIPQPLNYRGRNINIQVPPLQLAAADKDPADYYVMDQGMIYSNIGKIIAGLLLLGLMLALFFKRKTIQRFFQKFRNDPIENAKNKFDGMFTMANKREDYEAIYAQRHEWLSLIKEVPPAYNDFFKTLEQHQYKKTWTADDLNDVNNSFDIIRRSFK